MGHPSRVPAARPWGHNWPDKNSNHSNPAHWTALENIKEGIHFGLPTNKRPPHGHSYYTKVIDKKLNDKKVHFFTITETFCFTIKRQKCTFSSN